MAANPEIYPLSDEDAEMLYEAIGVSFEELVEMKENEQQQQLKKLFGKVVEGK